MKDQGQNHITISVTTAKFIPGMITHLHERKLNLPGIEESLFAIFALLA